MSSSPASTPTLRVHLLLLGNGQQATGNSALEAPIVRTESRLALATLPLLGAPATLAGDAEGWRWQLELLTQGAASGRYQAVLHLRCAETVDLALGIALAGLGAQPRWLMPGNFYDQNRPADSPRRYPRWGLDDDPWSALAWCFSAERAALPFVSVVTDAHAAALVAASPYWQNQPVGLGLAAADDTSLLLRYPFAETPRSDAPCRGDGCAPVMAWQRVQRGEQLSIACEVWVAPAACGPLYPALLRALARDEGAARSANDPSDPARSTLSSAGGAETAREATADEAPANAQAAPIPTAHTPARTKPWMPTDAAAALLGEGLLRWHYDPEAAVLAETSAFDHYFRPSDRQTDRAAMHVAWLSGIPTAFALLRQGGAAAAAGRNVIDHIARDGLAPCGAFWAQWTPQGWGTCWYGPPEGAPPWLQAATTAEATLFLLQAIAHEQNQGRPQLAWEHAARSNLEFVVARQRADGNLGAYYDAQSGAVTLWEGSAGLLWVAALVAGWRRWGEKKLLDTALRAADYYAPAVLEDRLRGAPEDVPLGPTSMDGYCATRAYWDLYAASGDARWLAIARHATDWTLTFRWAYNVRFDPRSFLGVRDFRTIGGDLASPSNQHLHVYGMIALPELLRLWQTTGDDLYFAAAADLLGFARQTLARVDGEGNARRGMYTEQWYHVDWTHPKGTMLQLAHAWCNGLAIYGFQEARRFGELWIGERVWCLEPAALVEPIPDPAHIRLHNPFDAPLTLRARPREPWRALLLDGELLPLQSDELGAYAEIRLEVGQRPALEPR